MDDAPIARILAVLCLGGVVGLSLHCLTASTSASVLLPVQLPTPTPTLTRPLVSFLNAHEFSKWVTIRADAAPTMRVNLPLTRAQRSTQQARWGLPLLWGCMAFLGAAVAGRLWRRVEAVAVASATGGYFRPWPQTTARSGGAPPLWGRRSAKIAHTKGREDMRRTKLYARFGKRIIMAVKAGGSTDPSFNRQLRDVIREAREANVPMANIDRAMKRGQDVNSEDFREGVFEAYGKGGAGIVITVLTDNTNRAANEVKATVGRAGLTNANPGSVTFHFKRVGAIVCPKQVSEDLAIEAAMEAEVDDVSVKEGGDGEWLVLTEPTSLMALKAALVCKAVECGETKLVFHPTTTVECSEEDFDFNMAVIEKLLDLDDVDAVHHNMG